MFASNCPLDESGEVRLGSLLDGSGPASVTLSDSQSVHHGVIAGDASWGVDEAMIAAAAAVPAWTVQVTDGGARPAPPAEREHVDHATGAVGARTHLATALNAMERNASANYLLSRRAFPPTSEAPALLWLIRDLDLIVRDDATIAGELERLVIRSHPLGVAVWTTVSGLDLACFGSPILRVCLTQRNLVRFHTFSWSHLVLPHGCAPHALPHDGASFQLWRSGMEAAALARVDWP